MNWLGDLWASFHELLSSLLHWVESFSASPHGAWALFFIALAESSFFPIPPDVLLIALCLGRPDHALWFALICSVGSVLGGVAGYAIGLYGGRPLLIRWFGERRLAPVERYYDKYDAWAIGIAGLTPIPYKIFTISAGAFRINLRIFVLASVLSRSARFFVVAGLIYLYGEPVRQFIETYLDWLSIAFVILLVLGFWAINRRVRTIGPESDRDSAG